MNTVGKLIDKTESLNNRKLKTFLRAQSPDDLPIVGALKFYPNVYINSGHGSHSVGLALACGKATSDLMTKGDCCAVLSSDPTGKSISPLRFNL